MQPLLLRSESGTTRALVLAERRTLYLAHQVQRASKPAGRPSEIAKTEHCENGLAQSLLESFLDGCDISV